MPRSWFGTVTCRLISCGMGSVAGFLLLTEKGDTMIPSRSTPTDAEAEGRILSLLRERKRLTFLSMAEALPEYRWHLLLTGLNRLQDRGLVEVSALQWDYEVVPLERKGGSKRGRMSARSEEHTSELQSQSNLVCRLLLEKKKKQPIDRLTAQLH